MKIAVIGLGKLGLPTACCFAEATLVVGCQHTVVGIDTNKAFIDALNAGRCPVDEPGMVALLARTRKNTVFSTHFDDIGDDCDIYFIVVPTPSGDDNCFRNDYVCGALEQLAPLLEKQFGRGYYPVVDCVSTVMPGTSQEVFIPLLERLTGGVCGADFGFVYNPEFIALGSVIRDFKNPDMVLIGESDERAGERVAKVYARLLGTDINSVYMSERVASAETARSRICRMDLLSAEITKLSLNCSLSMKIAIGNFLAFVCEMFPGADVDKVVGAIGKDSRIGPKLLKAGLGAGGSCLPRDLRALRTVVPDEYHPFVMQRQVNLWIRNIVVGRVHEQLPAGSKVAILGMGYKPGTWVYEESESVLIAEMLHADGYEVAWYDPKVPAAAFDKVPKAASPTRACVDVAAVLVLTPDPLWSKLPWDVLVEVAAPSVYILDVWRILRDLTWPAGVRYWAFGLNLNR